VKTVCIQASHLPSFIHQNPGEFLEQLPSFDQLLAASTAAWQGIWDKIDIRLQGDRLSQKLLRLHLYHLISTFSPHNENIDFSIPARGLTGEAYRGHIFWDELYILPLYFMHFPELARSALICLYRYRRQEEAGNYAAEFGYQGAMFPWQSGSNGRERHSAFIFNPVSGKWDPDYSSFQRHVNLAIAYNILQYHHYTQDEDFMLDYGAEMLIEICRLWSRQASGIPEIRRFSIAKVMGPDEFHEHGTGLRRRRG
jgi:trehalose/maltose hydrolase-like predicted phosphorylase